MNKQISLILSTVVMVATMRECADEKLFHKQFTIVIHGRVNHKYVLNIMGIFP